MYVAKSADIESDINIKPSDTACQGVNAAGIYQCLQQPNFNPLIRVKNIYKYI